MLPYTMNDTIIFIAYEYTVVSIYALISYTYSCACLSYTLYIYTLYTI